MHFSDMGKKLILKISNFEHTKVSGDKIEEKIWSRTDLFFMLRNFFVAFRINYTYTNFNKTSLPTCNEGSGTGYLPNSYLCFSNVLPLADFCYSRLLTRLISMQSEYLIKLGKTSFKKVFYIF